MSQTVIKVENLYKEYKLGVIGHGTLYRDLQSWWARVRGKEDPNSLISSQYTQKAEKESFLALTDISMEIKAGDCVGIIGKNGAGKSTLLKILSRITSPTKGVIKIKGSIGSLLEVGTGFHSELTGKENIYLNGAILGMNRHEVTRKLDEIVDFAGVGKHLDTPVKRYSSGMMVRLGFAVAAHLETDILIADEVLAVGDAEFQKKAIGKMRGLSAEQGRTVLFVSHNMASVEKLCNFGLVFDRGRICYEGGIKSCISIYTEMTSPPILVEIKSERYYELDETKPFQIEKIEILNEKRKQCSAYEAHEEVVIRLHFISRNPMLQTYGYIIIKNENGENLLWCYSTEDGHDIFNNMPTGKYNIELTIMKGILSCGEYVVNLGFGGHAEEQYFNALKFNVIDTVSLYSDTSRHRILPAILEWKISGKVNL